MEALFKDREEALSKIKREALFDDRKKGGFHKSNEGRGRLVIGKQAQWEVRQENSYMVQDHVRAALELRQKGLSLLASTMYAALANRCQLSIWNNWTIFNRLSMFYGEYFIIYPEKELEGDLDYSLPAIRKAFNELSKDGYVLRYKAGGGDSRTPSKIIVFPVNHPFKFKDEWQEIDRRRSENPEQSVEEIQLDILREKREKRQKRSLRKNKRTRSPLEHDKSTTILDI